MARVLVRLLQRGRLINAYYLAALVPAVAALCAFGARLAWQRRRSRAVRAVLALTTIAAVAAAIALVPSYVGVRSWIIASLVVVGALGAGILLVSLAPRHASVWAHSVGPVLAVLAILLGGAWASGLVVMEELGPFDSPYATAARNQVTRDYADDFPRLQAVLMQFTSRLPPDVAANTIETTLAASDDILATGHEFLPVGGYTGEVPTPTLAQFVRYVAEDRVRFANVADAATHPQPRPSLGRRPLHQDEQLLRRTRADHVHRLLVRAGGRRRERRRQDQRQRAAWKSMKSETRNSRRTNRAGAGTFWWCGSVTIPGSDSSCWRRLEVSRTAPCASAFLTQSASRP